MDEPDALPQPAATHLHLGGLTTTDVLMLCVVVIWGVNFSIVKVSLSEMSPLAFNGLRFFLASTTLLILTRLIEGELRIHRGDWLRLFGVGLIGHTIYQLLFIIGLSRTQAGHSALMLGLTPVFVALIGFALGIERVRRLVWVGILLSFTGIVLITSGGNGGLSLGGPTLSGDLLTVTATACWATYTVLSKPLLTRYSPLQFTTLTMALGAAPLLVIAAPSVAAQDWGQVTRAGWFGLLFSFSLAVVVAYIIWYTSVQRVGGARTAIFSNVQPLIGLLAAWLILGETLTPPQLVGAAVVIVGVALARRG